MKYRTRREKKQKEKSDWVLPALSAFLLALTIFVFSIDGFDKFRSPKNSILFISLSILLSGYILKHKSLPVRIRLWSWESLLLVGILYTGLHTLTSSNLSSSFDGFLGIIAGVLLIWTLKKLLSVENQKKVWIVIGAATGINGLFTALQYLGYFPVMEDTAGSMAFGRLNPAGFVGEVNSGGFLFGLVCLPLVYFLVVEKNNGTRLLAAGLILLNLVGLAFTQTLTAAFAASVCGVLWLIFHHWWVLKQQKTSYRGLAVLWAIIILLVIGGGLITSRTGLLGRVNMVTDRVQQGDWMIATAGRQPVYLLSWMMIKENPILGRGLNTFPVEFFDFKVNTEVGRGVTLMHQPGAFRQVHNEYLQTWLELGLPGFLLLIGVLFVPLYRSRRKILENPESNESYWIGLLSLGLIYISIACLAFFPLHVAVCLVAVFLLVANLRRATEETDESSEELILDVNLKLKNQLCYLIAGLLILGVGSFQVLQWQANIEVGNASGLLDRLAVSQFNPRLKRAVGEEILKRLDKADSRSRNYHEIDSLKGSAHFFLGNAEKARENYENAVQTIPSPELMTNLATAHIALKEYDKAESFLQIALNYDNQTETALNALEYIKGKKVE